MGLFDLLTKPGAAPAVSAPSPLERLKQSVGNLDQLPMLPEAARKAMAIANNPTSSLGTLAAVIEHDPRLAAGILKLANSSLYRLGRTIHSLEQAVVRLGLRECHHLILTVGMKSMCRGTTAASKRACELLWRHAFLTACLCRRLNHSLQLGHQGEEFSCGLTHDLGRILFAMGAPTYFSAADPLTFQEEDGVLDRERAVLGTDHCYFGAWFATVNQLPSSVISAIQFHHAPEQADEHRALVTVVAMADHMANYLHREQKSRDYSLATNRAWYLLAQDWDDQVRTASEERMASILDQTLKEANEFTSLSAA